MDCSVYVLTSSVKERINSADICTVYGKTADGRSIALQLPVPSYKLYFRHSNRDKIQDAIACLQMGIQTELYRVFTEIKYMGECYASSPSQFWCLESPCIKVIREARHILKTCELYSNVPSCERDLAARLNDVHGVGWYLAKCTFYDCGACGWNKIHSHARVHEMKAHRPDDSPPPLKIWCGSHVVTFTVRDTSIQQHDRDDGEYDFTCVHSNCGMICRIDSPTPSLQFTLDEGKNKLIEYMATCQASNSFCSMLIDLRTPMKISHLRCFEMSMSREAICSNVVFKYPTDNTPPQAEGTSSGGLFLPPHKGFHREGIIEMRDFKSMYGSIVCTFNIDKTTAVRNKEKEASKFHLSNGKEFVTHTVRKGLMPSFIEQLMKQRDRCCSSSDSTWHCLIAKVCKLLIVGAYGVNYLPSAFTDIELARAIATEGRHLLETMRMATGTFKHDLLKQPIQVLCGHTDSLMTMAITKTKQLTNVEEQYLSDSLQTHYEIMLNETFPENHCFQFELKRKIDKALCLSQKQRYVFSCQGEITIKGFRWTMPLIESIYKSLFSLLFHQQDIDAIKRLIHDQICRIQKGECELWEFIKRLPESRVTDKLRSEYNRLIGKQPEVYYYVDTIEEGYTHPLIALFRELNVDPERMIGEVKRTFFGNGSILHALDCAEYVPVAVSRSMDSPIIENRCNQCTVKRYPVDEGTDIYARDKQIRNENVVVLFNDSQTYYIVNCTDVFCRGVYQFVKLLKQSLAK